MSTKIRPTVSKKKAYYISKHRYYELKHFCLQYNEWKNLIFSRSGNLTKSFEFHGKRQVEFSDPVADEVIRLENAKRNVQLVEDSATCTDDFLAPYILKAVTEGVSYTYLKMVEDMPCSRDHFYVCYHKFFWILDYKKQCV